MAPIRPSSEGKRKVKPQSTKAHTRYPARETDSAFTSTKKDRRLMKHSIFMSKLQDSGVKKLKRRRPGKKLVTNLESLEDALEDVVSDEASKPKAPQMKNVRDGRGQAKRREKLVKQERERFGQNMAVLTATNAQSKGAGAVPGNRWAALRAHINANASDMTSGAG